MAYGKAGDWYANNNIEGGGGETWNTVFEGNVTTVDDEGDITVNIEELTLNGNSIRVTFNGYVYELPKTEHGYGSENESGIDFSTYPLFIATGQDSCTLWTPTAGTYSLKIEEPQSGGGSSDLTWILPEQTVTLVDQPVEITGLRLDLIPQGVEEVPLKYTTENFGHLHTYYAALHYDGSALSEDNGTFSIYPQDGSYYFVNSDEETIIKGEYTISIALF